MSVFILSQYFHPEPNGSEPPVTDLAPWLAGAWHESDVVMARRCARTGCLSPGTYGTPARDTSREALAHLVHDTLHRGVFHTQRALRRWPAPRGHEARS
ncbi:hypothetical protein L2D00_06525 [Hyphomonadaceae bacterium BL14]|nr:hypothetical protein L2D00_06525 [Hyphomonadaceae bacterium BL14]